MAKIGWTLLIISACVLLKDALCVLVPLAGVIIGWILIKGSNKKKNNGGTDIIIP